MALSIWLNLYLGTIYGTPEQKHTGEFFINVTCKDTVGVYDWFNLSIQVSPTNDPPEIVNPENSTVWIIEETLYYHTFTERRISLTFYLLMPIYIYMPTILFVFWHMKKM